MRGQPSFPLSRRTIFMKYATYLAQSTCWKKGLLPQSFGGSVGRPLICCHASSWSQNRHVGCGIGPSPRLCCYRFRTYNGCPAHVPSPHAMGTHGGVFLVVFAAAILMMPAWSKYPVSSLCLKFPFGLLVILVIYSLFRLSSFDNVLARVLPVPFSDFVTSLQKLARQIRT